MEKPKLNNINKDWKDAFPKLKTIGSNKLCVIVGPILVGIELVKSKYGGHSGGHYRPYIMISSLFGSEIATNRSGNQLKNCLNSPNFYFGLVNAKNVQFDINYGSSSDIIDEAIIQMRKQNLPLEQNITINELFDFIDLNKSQTSIALGGAGALAYLLEFKLLLTLYINDENLKAKVFEEIEYHKKFWNMKHFETWIGDYNAWIDKLKHTTHAEVVYSVNNILADPKLKNLNKYKLEIK